MSFLSRLRRETSGNAALIVAGTFSAFVASAALAVDIGSAYTAKRRLQGIADAAALAAAGAGDPNAAVRQVLTLYGTSDVQIVSITPGTYAVDTTMAAAARFTAGAAGSGNAARVTLSQPTRLFFMPALTGNRNATVNANALATRINLASFSIGSRLVGLQGGLLNNWLSALTGSKINLSVMDYNSLAGADINLLAFADALRTSEHLQAVSYSDVLQSQTTLPTLVQAMAAATSGSSATALNNLAAQLPATAITPSALINLGPSGLDTTVGGTSVAVNALGMAREALTLASGVHQATFDSGVTVPGVTSTTISLTVGSRMANSPWVAVTDKNTVVVTTSQARLQVDSKVSVPLLAGAPLLDLPIEVDLAQASANLKSLTCNARQPQSAVLSVTPSIGSAALGAASSSNLSNLQTPMQTTPATLLSLPLISVTGQAQIQLGGVTPQQVSFNSSQIAAQAIQTVSTTDLVSGIATSLISKANIQANVLGLGISVTPVTAAVGSALNSVAPALDSLLNSTTGLLGLGLGQADVRIDGVRCGAPVIVG